MAKPRHTFFKFCDRCGKKFRPVGKCQMICANCNRSGKALRKDGYTYGLLNKKLNSATMKKENQMKTKCKSCAEWSKRYAKLSKRYAENSKYYDEKSKYFAEWSKRYTELSKKYKTCQCGDKQ